MTLPSSPVNNQGPYYTSNVPVNTTPANPPGPEQAVPNSPDGASLTPRQYDEGWNYENSLTSTEAVLQEVLVVESAQEGSPALANTSVQVTLAGVASTALQINNSYGGSVGVVGNKFS